METETIAVATQKRFAYQIADMLPKQLRVVYYAILWLSLVYLIIRVTTMILKITQKAGAMIFDEKHFYFLVIVTFTGFIIWLLVSQFYFDLDPIGHFITWFINQLNKIKTEVIDEIINWLRTI